MTNLKRVCLVVLIMILLGATVVFATDDDTIVISGENTIIGGNSVPNNIVENTVIQTNTNSSYNNATNLPQTGADDYAIVLVIGVFAVSAVYAYKKIRDYKSI